MLLEEKELTVAAVTCAGSRKLNKPANLSGKMLLDVADIVIDNCCPPEDTLVPVAGRPEKVGGSSTLTVVPITMALSTGTAAELVRLGKTPERIFVSPNVPGVYRRIITCWSSAIIRTSRKASEGDENLPGPFLEFRQGEGYQHTLSSYPYS